MSITVVTTPGNMYLVEKGDLIERETTVTGELSVTVLGPYGDSILRTDLAHFGSVEAVYRTGAVQDITPDGDEPAAPEPLKKPSNPWG